VTDAKCKIAMIVAVADNGVIGAGNKIPWKCSSDMKYFRKTTMGKPVIMGRKTWESLGRPLAGRKNIVISQNPDFEAEGAFRVTSIDRALGIALASLKEEGGAEVMIIGGGAIYEQVLQASLVCRIYKTQIHMEPSGDTHFRSDKELAALGFAEVSREFQKAGSKDEADMTFIVLEKAKKR